MRISSLVLLFITKFTASDCLLYELVGQGLLNGLLRRPPPWVPKLNPIFVGLDLDDIKSKFLGAKPFLDLSKLKTVLDPGLSPKEPQLGTIGASTFQRRARAASNSNLPTSFDWRQSTKCKSFSHVRKQSCSDCWAVSSAAAISDRYCLYTNQNLYFSARELGACVYKGTGGGCDGGYASDAFQFFKKTGIVQGGDPTLADEPKSCLPYKTMTSKSACPIRCDDGSTFGGMKSGGDYRMITSRNVTEIQQEIYRFGPVVTIFEMFDDFYYLGSGVYKHTSGSSQGYHAIRIIGWGVDNNVPYWLCVNQWGPTFAENGFFKILRGSNHCNVENWVAAQYPAEAF